LMGGGRRGAGTSARDPNMARATEASADLPAI